MVARRLVSLFKSSASKEQVPAKGLQSESLPLCFAPSFLARLEDWLFVWRLLIGILFGDVILDSKSRLFLPLLAEWALSSGFRLAPLEDLPSFLHRLRLDF